MAVESSQGNSSDQGVAVASDDTETEDADSSVISVSDADSFSEAVTQANASESAVTIQLTGDVALDTSAIFTGTAAVTLDLAGHAISRGSSTTGYLVGIASGSSLAVTDSVGTGYIDGATYTVGSSTYVGYSILTNGTLTLDSGTLKGYYGLYISGSGANVTISGSGAVEGTSRGISMSSGALTVKAGTITGGAYGIVQLSGETIINGGTVGTAGEGRGIQHQGGTLTINSGTILGEYAVTSNAYNADTTLTVTGGIIGDTSESTNDLSSMALVGVFVIGSTTTYNATADISGGTITAYDSGVYIQGNVAAGDTSEKQAYNATVTVSDDAVIKTVYNSTYGYSDSGVSVWGKGAVLNVEGGTISSGVFAIAGNGTYNTSGSGYSHAGTVINISDGKISSGGTAIYHPQYGSLIIKGGTITGATTGIEIRAGEAKISGDDTFISSDYNPLDYKENGNGTTVAGAALAVSQHTTKLNISVEISGGSFEGFYGVYEANVQGNEFDEGDAYENYINVEISGGKFYTRYATSLEEYTEALETGVTSVVYGYAVLGTSSETLKVTGGYFNSNPSKCYVDIESGSDYETRDFVADPYYVVTRSDSYTDTDLAADYPFYVTDNRIVAAGIDLASGYFEVNFYVDSKADDYSAIEGLTINEVSKSISQTNAEVSIDDDSSYNCDVYTQQVNPQYIATDIIVTLELAEGYAVSQTTTMKDLITGWLTTDYATSLGSDEAAVLIAMLNYGAAAQYYVNSTRDIFMRVREEITGNVPVVLID